MMLKSLMHDEHFSISARLPAGGFSAFQLV